MNVVGELEKAASVLMVGVDNRCILYITSGEFLPELLL